MLEQGLLKEATDLFKKYGENKILLGTIGYQELYPFLKGETDFNIAIEQLKQNTRRYAKRQISWFNANKDIHWFDIQKEDINEMKSFILYKYEKL